MWQRPGAIDFRNVRWKTVRPGRDDWSTSIYAGKPRHESDRAWEGLQTVRGIWVTEEESLETKIEGLKGGDQKLAVLLGVMHNIHCLRSIRQMLHPAYYYPNLTEHEHEKLLAHSSHCLEAIRTSVMCVPDLSPQPSDWDDEERASIHVNPQATRQCVDWDSLVEWEKPREILIEDIRAANPE